MQLPQAFILLSAPWIGLDDPYYVLSNHNVRSGLSLKNAVWSFTTVYYGNWMPLTWLSYQLDASIHSLDARGFHLTNLLLNYICSALFFLVLFKASRKLLPSAICALLFSVHPLHIESVAWISSRKDLLAGTSWMLALLAYISYAQRPSTAGYLRALGCAILAYLCKPSTVPLPFVFFAIDFWPLNRLSRERLQLLFWEKVPFIVIGIIALSFSFFGQSAPGADISAGYLTTDIRIRNALVFLGTYFFRAIWPASLAIEYPHLLDSDLLTAQYLTTGGFLAFCTLTVALRKQAPWLLSGLIWFFFAISLNLQLMQIGNQATSDRHMYIALAGIAIAFSWSLFAVAQARVCILIAGILTLVLSIISSQLAQSWLSPISLFSRATSLYPNATNSWIYLGDEFRNAGNFKLAKQNYLNALKHEPEKITAFLRLNELAAKGKISAEHNNWLLFAEYTPDSSFAKRLSRSIMLSYSATADSDCELNKKSCEDLADSYLAGVINEGGSKPQVLQATHLQAVYWYKKQQWTKAIELLEHVVKHQHSRIDAKLLLAHSLIENKQNSQAAKLLQQLDENLLGKHEQEQLRYLKDRLKFKQS